MRSMLGGFWGREAAELLALIILNAQTRLRAAITRERLIFAQKKPRTRINPVRGLQQQWN